MSEEERRAIENLDKRLTIEKYTKNIGTPVYISDLTIALNLIQKQQTEIKLYKEQLNKIDKVLEVKEGVAMPETSEIVKLLKDTVRDYYEEIEKKNKIIDLMTERIVIGGIKWRDKEEVKEYFEKKAEE